MSLRSEALVVAYQQGLQGRPKQWVHNLGDAFEHRMRASYAAGKREKIRLAEISMANREGRG